MMHTISLLVLFATFSQLAQATCMPCTVTYCDPPVVFYQVAEVGCDAIDRSWLIEKTTPECQDFVIPRVCAFLRAASLKNKATQCSPEILWCLDYCQSVWSCLSNADSLINCADLSASNGTCLAVVEEQVEAEKPYKIPEFPIHNTAPVIYVSFGSLGSSEFDLLHRIVSVLGKLPYRVLANVGSNLKKFTNVPQNVHLSNWFPQPSVIPQMSVVIHHGGNNSFNECLYFGIPAICMPFVWDGHDNATRLAEKKYGFFLHRYNWTEEEMAATIAQCISDQDLQSRLKTLAKHMQANHGPTKAAKLLAELSSMT